MGKSSSLIFTLERFPSRFFLKRNKKLFLPSIKDKYPHSGLLEAFSWERVYITSPWLKKHRFDEMKYYPEPGFLR